MKDIIACRTAVSSAAAYHVGVYDVVGAGHAEYICGQYYKKTQTDD
jgi:hypothetical protein